jgi:hypothetical protein
MSAAARPGPPGAEDQGSDPVASGTPAATARPLAVSAIVVHAEAPLVLADFWSRAFGVPVDPGSTADSASLVTSPRVPPLAFERSDGPGRRPGEMTVRAYADDLEDRIRRLGDMGTRASRYRERAGDRDVAEIHDPEGNRIVIVQLRGDGRGGATRPPRDGGRAASEAPSTSPRHAAVPRPARAATPRGDAARGTRARD